MLTFCYEFYEKIDVIIPIVLNLRIKLTILSNLYIRYI